MTAPISQLNAALEGRYRVERELGEGGMATVYLADDLRHERKVAVKVLRPELAAVVGAERFLAEIKTTANLQHPNILPLFDSGAAGSFLYYVMPYVEGETLRDRLDREQQLPVDEAVRITTDVAEALEAAHEQGVIHRDIKPANILLSKGRPLVADFGIALAVSAAGGGRLTETGLSIGTPYYMSPEQASADRRPTAASDVYSLGCVLYEMLVGEPPHTGGSAQAVLAKILMDEAPTPAKVRRSIPAHVDAAIRKALEKLPADRFSSAHEFAEALTDPGFRYGDQAGAARGSGAGLWKPLSIAASGLASIFALAFAWSAFGPEEAPAPLPVSRHVVSGPPALPVFTTALQGDVAMSRDGRTIVYAVGGAGGTNVDLAVRALDGLQSAILQGTSLGAGPFLSPDGEWVAFQAGLGGPLARMSIRGGPSVRITPMPNDLRGASWGPDGTIVFAVAAPMGLQQVPAAGGEARALTETDGVTAHQFPEVLPNGRGVLFAASSIGQSSLDDQIAVLDLRTGEHRVIVASGFSPRYAASGHIVYAVGTTLWAVGFDAERLLVTSDPVPVVEGVMTKTSGAASFALSESGSLVYVTGVAGGSLFTPVWVDREGREEPLPLPPRPYANPRLSPDGTRLAIGVSGADGTTSLWVFDVGSAAGLRLTQEGVTNVPIWTPDGRVIFASNAAGGPFQIHSVRADGSGPPERLLAAEGINGDYPTSVTPDGRYVVFSRIFTLPHREVFQLPLQGEATPEPLLRGEFNRGNAEISPDGRWMVYRSDQSGQMEVYVQPYPGPGPTVPVSIGGGTSVTWSPDGRELIYRLDDRVMAVSFDASAGTPRIGPPTELFRGSYYAPVLGGTRQYHVAPDGRFLMLKPAVAAGDDPLPPQVVLVQNWFEELKRLVPVE
jgi:serine/threonine-protein kinase